LAYLSHIIYILAATLALPDTEQADTISTQRLDEVVVTEQSVVTQHKSASIGAEPLAIDALTTAPSLLGENDIMRALQLLPGVKAESEGSSSIQVRGGTSAQNAILYDHAPIYNVGHMAGLFSTFNDEALGDATLYKGLMPAEHGGATAAVLDITGRKGRTDRWHAGGSIGLLSAKVGVEGPLPLPGTASLMFCARRSWADMLLKLSDTFRGNTLYFYDINLKAADQLDDQNSIELSLFASKDKTRLKDMVGLGWQNLATSLSWNHRFGDTADSQTSIFFSNYTTDNSIDLLGMDLSFSGHIRQGGLRQHFSIALGRHTLTAGGQSALLSVKSAEWQNVSNHEKEQRGAWENTLWAGITLKPTNNLTAVFGLRFTAFSSLGGPYYYEVDERGDIAWYYKTRHGRIVNTHLTLDPRISLNYAINSAINVKAGYSRTTQNIHALRGQTTSTPFDRYTLSSNLLQPQRADQLSIGISASTPRHRYSLSLEGYYRHVGNLLDYRDGVSFGSEIEMERLVLPGQGRSYGLELMARRNTGRLRGWLAYTLSWSENKIAGINGGRWYTANNDRRHDIDIVATYRLSDTWTLSALWVYNSGQAFTAPSGKYEIIDNYIYYYAERNGYRTPATHHLDVSATWTKHIARGRLTREWSFGIYNLYNRYNPFLITFEDSEYGARTKARQYSLFGIVPSVSFCLKY
jgi:hypothetical protein